jgi:hypothetical protein
LAFRLLIQHPIICKHYPLQDYRALVSGNFDRQFARAIRTQHEVSSSGASTGAVSYAFAEFYQSFTKRLRFGTISRSAARGAQSRACCSVTNKRDVTAGEAVAVATATP